MLHFFLFSFSFFLLPAKANNRTVCLGKCLQNSNKWTFHVVMEQGTRPAAFKRVLAYTDQHALRLNGTMVVCRHTGNNKQRGFAWAISSAQEHEILHFATLILIQSVRWLGGERKNIRRCGI